jgi:hypothetical protein
MFAKALFSLALLAAPVFAQTYSTDQAQIEACRRSISMEDYPASETYTFATTDTSAYTGDFTYNPQYCTASSTQAAVRFRAVLTENINGGSYTCTSPPFDNTGNMIVTCSATK